ncbi:MAG: multicopper oxidase domain-containing protein, partial [Anaerolineales bacterium]
MVSRRGFLKVTGAATAGALLATKYGSVRRALAVPAAAGLSDPALQPKFVNLVPDALSPGFKYMADKKGKYKVQVREAVQYTGLVAPDGVTPVPTPVWGYADQMTNKKVATWPGKTFEVKSVSAGGPPETEVFWANALRKVNQHLLPVDTNLHWCYSLHGYENYTIANHGVPIITHLHGGHTDFQFDGNPEFFYTPGEVIVGPQWANVPEGFTTKFRYDNNVPAGNLWYHDHALGITRLNVYAGLAGFYFVRDKFDTGLPDNPLTLPAWPYEKAYAIQDRMFRNTGELFYSAFPGDPFYDDFITDEGAILPPELFPGGGPTALAEFFGDHMVVNGLIWPKENVEPRRYRLHLLNGTDSRFMMIRFRVAATPTSTDLNGAGAPLPFYVIGSDQGLASAATQTDTLLFEPGGRYDIVFDFKDLQGQRIIMENLLGDAPFGGDLPTSEDLFPDRQTDRIMAFDVANMVNVEDGFDPGMIDFGSAVGSPTVTRQVALFEGKDEFGRLQPLLGAFTGTEFEAIPWHSPTTENPALNATEEWEIYNFTGDAHPVHLHLVNFEILGRQAITFDADDSVNPQVIVQHNGALGMAPRISNIVPGDAVNLTPADGYVENAPKDMVTALPEQITRIKATFDKPGRYVWHCHILSHE